MCVYNIVLFTIFSSFLRCNFEAWIYLWDAPSWEHEVTSWSDRFSVGNGKSHVLPLCDSFVKLINLFLPH